MIMDPMPYMLTLHYIVLAMRDVKFPTTKAELIEKSPETVNAYLELVASSCEKCASDVDAVADAAVTLEILPNAKVARSAIPGCAIRYLSAKDAKEQVERTANIDLTQFGGAVPADDFYYGAE